MLLGGHEVAKVRAAAAAQVRPRLRVLPSSGHRKNLGQNSINIFKHNLANNAILYWKPL